MSPSNHAIMNSRYDFHITSQSGQQHIRRHLRSTIHAEHQKSHYVPILLKEGYLDIYDFPTKLCRAEIGA